MPYSDNLYSADIESDAESFIDQLSPTDGYFNRMDIPRQNLVPDPSQNSESSDDKDELARQEARQASEVASRTAGSPTLSHMYPSLPDASAATSVYTPSSPVSNIPSSPVSSRRTDTLYSERTSLRHPPPPAYSASPTTSPVAPVSPEPRNYSTFAPHQLEQGLPSRQEPESMGGAIDIPNERTPLSISQSEGSSLPPFKTIRSSPCRSLTRKVLFFALVVTVVVILLTTMLHSRPNNHKGDNNKDAPPDDTPSGSYCAAANIKQPEDIIFYDFGQNENLMIIQSTHQRGGSYSSAHVKTSGEIRLRRLPKGSKYGSHFTLDVRVSHPNLTITKDWDGNSRTLEVSTPQHVELEATGPHCVSLEITAWLPEDARLSSLQVSSETLSLRVLEDLNINISGAAHLTTISGAIYFPKFDSPKGRGKKRYDDDPSFSIPGHAFNTRRVEVETISGSISGLFPLYDLLGLYSQSGSINVGVLPHSADPAAPSPARLEVKTQSSSINVHLPVLGSRNQNITPPAREYYTQVHSTAGSICGSYYLGSSTTFKSVSGSLGLSVLPVVHSYGESYSKVGDFETATESGTTNIEILHPIYLQLVPSKRPDSSEGPERPELPYQPIGNDDPYLLLPPGGGHLLEDGLNDVEFESRDVKSENLKPCSSEGACALGSSGGKVRALRSSHSSTSGTINLQYPSVWEGTIGAKSVTGSIQILGNGVSIIREKNTWGRKEVVAKKGVDREGEGSSVVMKTVTGNLKFVI